MNPIFIKHFPYYFHAVLVQTMSKSPRKVLQESTLAILILDVSRQVGTDTGSDTDISPQIEIFTKGRFAELSTVIWLCCTWHIVTYQANITID